MKMDHAQIIVPRPGYRVPAARMRILPRADYNAPSLHTRELYGTIVNKVEAEWCPVCLGRKISERLASRGPVWHCDECGNEW